MFEINGELGAWLALFGTYVPDVCAFFHLIIIAIYIPEECMEKNHGRIVSKCTYPRGAQNKRLISNTGKVFVDVGILLQTVFSSVIMTILCNIMLLHPKKRDHFSN